MHGARMKNSLYVQMYSTVYKWQYKCMVRAYSTVQHSTVQYSTIQYSTIQYSTAQDNMISYSIT